MGGKQSHANGTAHEWTPEEAAAAGRVGGARSRKGSKKHPVQEEEGETES